MFQQCLCAQSIKHDFLIRNKTRPVLLYGKKMVSNEQIRVMVCIFLGFVASVFADATYNFIISDLSLFNQRERNSAFAKCWISEIADTHTFNENPLCHLPHPCLYSLTLKVP